ncbi:hypothetical protein [Methylobacterium radiodurans]|uniref:hypothetical protein n=1 Tax=Methylobacterium radiodurans TaxID=2202828 RepID=UPI0013A54E5C|nr:hypothetical protein [Methylobacterium radiodurans]
MSISSLIEKAPKWVIAIVSSVATTGAGIVTWFWTDYGTFRSAQNEINKTAAEQSIAADASLDQYIVKFKNLVIGKSEVTDKDRDEFSDAIRAAQAKAFELKNRYPSLVSYYDAYTNSLVGLKQSLNNLTGPLDGKKYVMALSRYFVAQQAWREEVSRAQSSYWRTFAFR